jgi:hypothetical protein
VLILLGFVGEGIVGNATKLGIGVGWGVGRRVRQFEVVHVGLVLQL